MRSVAGYVEEADVRRRPFRYFTSGRAMSPDVADGLLRWLETDARWHLHREAFFEQYECDLTGESIARKWPDLFGPEALRTLRTRMEVLLGAALTDRIGIVAHRLLPSQGIGVHTDEPRDGLETHRFVVQLNRGRGDDSGGHLLLFNSGNPLDVHAIVPPAHNTGFGFAMSERSHHAVSDVRDGVRYTVVYSFWRQDDPTGSGEPADEPEKSDGAEHLPGINLLERAGAGGTDHSGVDLLTHLRNTHTILRRWNCPDHLCTAGLFHSVYGTAAFGRSTFSPEQREIVRESIGPQAEHLAYLYCATSRRSLYDNLDRAGHHYLVSRRDGTTVPITDGCLADLMTLDLANSLEQLSRLPLTREIIETDRQIYRKATPLLPGAAVVEMNWVYQTRNIPPGEPPLDARLAGLDAEAQARVEKVLMAALASEGR